MGIGNPEAVQLSTSSSPSFAVIFESWRISGGTVNNAKDVTNTELARFFFYSQIQRMDRMFTFFSISKGVLPYMGYIGMGIPKGYGF